jgi:hypothetical protein
MRGLVILAALPLWAADVLDGLPSRPPVPPVAVAASVAEPVAPGVFLERGRRVELAGVINLDKGPVDGLEVLACLHGGKTHEALIRLDADDGAVVKAAVIAGLGLSDGLPAAEGLGLPARGRPVRLTVEWRTAAGQTVGIDASCLVRDRPTDRPYPPLPWIWTGSRFQTLHQTAADGTVVAREQFMLAITKSVAVNFDEPDALLASPFPDAATDARFEAYSRLCPPAGTPVRVVLTPAELPLTLDLDVSGALSYQAQAVDDQTLAALLTRHFDEAVALRAVGIVSRAGDRGMDAAVRRRVLAAAGQAGVWVVPVFLNG